MNKRKLGSDELKDVHKTVSRIWEEYRTHYKRGEISKSQKQRVKKVLRSYYQQSTLHVYVDSSFSVNQPLGIGICTVSYKTTDLSGYCFRDNGLTIQIGEILALKYGLIEAATLIANSIYPIKRVFVYSDQRDILQKMSFSTPATQSGGILEPFVHQVREELSIIRRTYPELHIEIRYIDSGFQKGNPFYLGAHHVALLAVRRNLE